MKVKVRETQKIKLDILERTLAAVISLPQVIDLDRKQPEFTLMSQAYLARVVTEVYIVARRKKIVIASPSVKQNRTSS